jgi:hydrogenase-4 component F
MELLLVLGLPLFGALLLAVWGSRPWAAEVNASMSLLTLLAAAALTAKVIALGPMTVWRELFFVDPFNVFLVALTAFVGFTTALFSRTYMRVEHERGKLSPGRLRLYHSMYQMFSFTMLLALLTNNVGILWVAMEAAATVLLVSLYRTPASIEAAWKYCPAAWDRASALYLAAEKVLFRAGRGVVVDALRGAGPAEPNGAAKSPCFLLVGYGQGGLPRCATAARCARRGPPDLRRAIRTAVGRGPLRVVRNKVLVDGALGTHLAGNLMMGFGLLSVVVAAFFLARQKDVKRLFAYSSIEHMGIITFAFGMGGGVASFAALLHMTAHSLTKSAIFFAVGHATQKTGTQVIERIRGLIHTSPTVGWGLMLGGIAILGIPPFGVFASEFLILTTAMQQQPWATPILLTSLAVAFAAIFGKLQAMVFGETTAQRLPYPPAVLPVFRAPDHPCCCSGCTFRAIWPIGTERPRG